MAVAELEPSIAWYSRLFGRGPDMRPNEPEAVWQLAGTASFYIVTDADRAGRSKLTLIVDDLQRHVAELAELGLSTPAVETVPGVFHKAVMADPEGNEIQLAQVLGQARLGTPCRRARWGLRPRRRRSGMMRSRSWPQPS